jgi:hypothetical protein
MVKMRAVSAGDEAVTRKSQRYCYHAAESVHVGRFVWWFYFHRDDMDSRLTGPPLAFSYHGALDSLDGRVARMTNCRVRSVSRWIRCLTWCRLAQHRAYRIRIGLSAGGTLDGLALLSTALALRQLVSM